MQCVLFTIGCCIKNVLRFTAFCCSNVMILQAGSVLHEIFKQPIGFYYAPYSTAKRPFKGALQSNECPTTRTKLCLCKHSKNCRKDVAFSGWYLCVFSVKHLNTEFQVVQGTVQQNEWRATRRKSCLGRTNNVKTCHPLFMLILQVKGTVVARMCGVTFVMTKR
jgi:hypothetical protein